MQIEKDNHSQHVIRLTSEIDFLKRDLEEVIHKQKTEQERT